MNWCCMIFICLLYSMISVGEVSCLLVSSILKITLYRFCFFCIERFFMICVALFKVSFTDSFVQFRYIFFVVRTYFSVVSNIFSETGYFHWAIFFFQTFAWFWFWRRCVLSIYFVFLSVLAFRFGIAWVNEL